MAGRGDVEIPHCPLYPPAGRQIGEQLGMDLSALRDEQMLDDYHYTIFPNVTLNVHGRGFWLFRRCPHPTDPERMLFDFQDYLRWPAALGVRKRPARRRDVAGGTSLGVVLDQDLYNLLRVQAGMRSRAFAGLLLSTQERRIRHFHRTLDGHLERANPAARGQRRGRRVVSEAEGRGGAAGLHSHVGIRPALGS